ncbi:squalene/phytoene synthase family protein [Palleronia sp. LCG004]|uniref:squalene/phytoene synthase family protein n=1 Tax=Palleronia sp. LCG004 TaxID=3079304 RepID=UPI0029434720|nr:squalene/phytoene synthase family protein [Palleronia sp. LCG004]WOI54925.1 squalene/phytoene synthase family protein [Palleronia sp. LCG004]
MSINECAEIVRRGDPDRFLAAMAAPPEARGVLFPLYACNVEIARAPYVTSEPMLAEIRLQWWRDALEEIRKGQTPRRHEVVEPLAGILDPQACETMTRIADARRWDAMAEPFLSAAQFRAHLDATNGNLLWTAARLLGAAAEEEGALRRLAFAEALARWFQAVPEMSARGLQPLVDDSPEAIGDLARDALKKMPDGRPSRAGRIAGLSAWEARVVLGQVAKDPGRALTGPLGQSGFRRRAALLWRSARI